MQKTAVIIVAAAVSMAFLFGMMTGRQAEQEKNRAEIEKQNAVFQKKLDSALSERDAALSAARRLERDLRIASDRLLKHSSTDAGTGASDTHRRLAGCERLLSESVRLHEESLGLLKRLEQDRRAMKKLLK